MLKAIIFDCDGVIADTEPLHLHALKEVLQEENIIITDREYYREFLALDDRGCFTKALSTSGHPLTQEKLSDLITRKAAYLEPVMHSQLQIFPGVKDFVRTVSTRFPLAIASGARREEIDLILKYGDLQEFFPVIISTEDVALGKPHPESFLKAWALLNERSEAPIGQHECLVVEDSFHGIHAAHSAGMRCLAITNSYPPDSLSEADLILDSLLSIAIDRLQSIFEK